MNPFIFLLGIFFRKLLKILFAPFIFIATYLFLTHVVQPLITDLTQAITSKFPELQGLNQFVGEIFTYLEVYRIVSIILATLTVLISIKMVGLTLRAFGFGNTGS
uniref:DUF2523 domain-containing protein n=2 Tax=unclassified Inovirus TaxID=356623 RepID=A0AAU8B4C1_9VIRU